MILPGIVLPWWSVWVAEWLALLALDHKGEIQLMTVQQFIAQNFSLSPFSHLDMTYSIRPNYRTVCLGFFLKNHTRKTCKILS